MKYVDSGELRSRRYSYWFRPASRKWLCVMIYDAPPATFSTGTKDASELLLRISVEEEH